MPNYRQRNKKKNNKKNKNNQNNKSKEQNISNQNQQGAQQQKAQEEQATTSLRAEEQATKLQHDQQVGNISNKPTADYSNKDHVEVSKIPTDNLENPENADDNDVDVDDAAAGTRSNEDAEEEYDDTVSKENSTQKDYVLDDIALNENETEYGQDINMGFKHSKETTFESEEAKSCTENCADQFSENEAKTQQVKVIIHRIVPEVKTDQHQPRVITHAIALEEEPEEDAEDEQEQYETDYADNAAYQVQTPCSPDVSFDKSNDDNENKLQIQEIFNEAESSVSDDLLADEDEIITLSNSSTTKNDDYKIKRAQKRVALESHFLPQLLSPRYLDSILEENSDLSDCSDRPGIFRSLSASSAEIEAGQELKAKRASAKFPRSQLDFSKTHKHGAMPNTLPSLPGPISEEPIAMMVEAKLIEQFPNTAEESCSTLTFKHLEPQLEAAEVIFINSSTSSSTSDLMELDEQDEPATISREIIDLDTDANEIISKPAENIVTVTLEGDLSASTSDRETTPVNNTSTTTASTDATEQTIADEANLTSIVATNEEYDHLNNDEQFSQCSTETIVDVSLASSSGHETSTSEQPQTADIKSSITDDSSVLSLTSVSDSSTLDASVEDSSSAEAFARLEETCREIMDNVRDVVFANSQLPKQSTNDNNINRTTKPIPNGLSYGLPPFSLAENTNITYTPNNANGKQKSPSPPPIPPPPHIDAYNKFTNINEQPSVFNQPQPKPIVTTCALQRQESADSHCSSSTNHSQITAINLAVNPTQRDVDISSPIFSDNEAQSVNKLNKTASEIYQLKQRNSESIQKLRQLCTQKLASLPYGEQVLIELANLAHNIGEMPIKGEAEIQSNLQELEKLIAQQQQEKHVKFQEVQKCEKIPNEILHKILYENSDHLLNKWHESEIVSSTEVKKVEEELRKNLSPSPPPLPPPPVPTKSSETAAKAQQKQQQQRETNTSSRIIPIVFEEKNDASARNVNAKEQKSAFTALNEDESIKQQKSEQSEKNNATNTTSSVENNSRQTEEYYNTAGKDFKEENYEKKYFSSEEEMKKQSTSSSTSFTSFPLKQEQPRTFAEMQSVESEIGRMFPKLGSANIFDDTQKRFSNIESSTSTKFPPHAPKRYSNIETTSYDAQKRIENGQVVYEYENKQQETHKDGDEVDACTLKSEHKIHDIHIDKSDTKQMPEHMRSTFNIDDFLQNTKNTKSHEEVQQKPSKIRVDEEKLLKDFDELSKMLHHELETGKQQREQREKSASLFDLNRSHMKHQLEELKKQREEHLKELEREIQRSAKSREARREMSYDQQERYQHEIPINRNLTSPIPPPRHQPTIPQSPKSHEIPIILDVNYTTKPATPPIKVEPVRSTRNGTGKLHEIPIVLERTTPVFEHDANSAFRRSESLHNLNNTNYGAEIFSRPRTASSNYEIQQQLLSDDWSQYASDVGSSEYITRPHVRERLSPRPREIRAPRLTVSSQDLSLSPTFDPHNAYNVPRTQRAPSSSLYSLYERDSATNENTQSTNCYSVLQRDPNPTYISTTSRRGVSPAPVQQPARPPQPAARRASLPHEIHEQQLKYLMSKEEELRLEFERLQTERRRLMEEMQREQAQPEESKPQFEPQPPPRLRDRTHYRAAPRLPTLSEDEVMRQQMAEEWLSKVAEREERRLQKIIKISNMHEEQQNAHNINEELLTTAISHVHKPDLSQEFLNRVKERRHKLHMPADSDWESGAESQPANKAKNEEGGAPEIKILSGRNVADPCNLPKHLKEFAHYSNQETEQLKNGGKRSVFEEEERRQEATPNTSSSSTKKSTIETTVKITRPPPQTLAPGQGRPYKSSGYQSEPEPNYDSDHSIVKYRTLDRRRLQSCSSNVNLRNNKNSFPDDSCYGTLPNSVKSSSSLYNNQPGRIEDYVTGRSSISEKEKREWWDEVMDIFNGHLENTKLSPRYAEGNLSRALAKDSGYASDSNLVFRKRELPKASPLSPVEQKQAYKSVQAGGEPPLYGFRKPAPEKPKDLGNAPSIPPPPRTYGTVPESPNRYFESDVNIHFKTPVRNEFKAPISEEELALRQSEHMQKLHQEERRRKYLQELQDMNSRRHTDNFSPSQKSPIPLNRYDDFQADLAPKSPNFANKLKMVVRALYNFQGQNARELSFKKGDIIHVRRQIDKNWYEGEYNAMIGLFPANYVEILSRDGGLRTPITKRPSEGQARAKYNFQAQSGVELSLNKGELVALTRRVDDNWFEGRIANRKGIFPVSYVEVLTDIGAEDIAAKTVIADYKPNLDALRTEVNNEFNQITRNGHHAPNGILKETKHLHKTDLLHVDTHSEPIAYRALYKYRPQNSDELELLEGDIVHVLEKCDDGWFVGTSQRTGCFGTFPGNYVERL